MEIKAQLRHKLYVRITEFTPCYWHSRLEENRGLSETAYEYKVRSFVKRSKMADVRPPSFLLRICKSGGNKKKPFLMNFSGRRHLSDRRASPVQTAHAFLRGEHALDKMLQI